MNSHIKLAIMASLADIFFVLYVAFTLKYVYEVIESGDIKNLLIFISIFVYIAIIVNLYNYYYRVKYTNSTARLTSHLNYMLIEKLFAFSIRDIKRQNSAKLLSVISTDINMAKGLYESIRLYISTVLRAIIPCILIFVMTKELFLVIISMAIIQALLILSVVKPLKKTSNRIRSHIAEMNMSVSKIFANNKIIRINNLQEYNIKVFNKLNRNIYLDKLKLSMLNSLTAIINIGFGLVGYVVTLFIGALLVNQNVLTLPNLLFITQIRNMLIFGVIMFSMFAAMFQPALVSAKKILQYLNITNT